MMKSSDAIRPYASERKELIGNPRVIPPPFASIFVEFASTQPKDPMLFCLLAPPSFTTMHDVFRVCLSSLSLTIVWSANMSFCQSGRCSTCSSKVVGGVGVFVWVFPGGFGAPVPSHSIGTASIGRDCSVWCAEWVAVLIFLLVAVVDMLYMCFPFEM